MACGPKLKEEEARHEEARLAHGCRRARTPPAMVPRSGAFMFDTLLGLSPTPALSPASSASSTASSSPCSTAATRSAVGKRPRALSSELAASEGLLSMKRRPPTERPQGADAGTAQLEAVRGVLCAAVLANDAATATAMLASPAFRAAVLLPDAEGRTPLHLCRAGTDPVLVRALLGGGASAGARDAARLTPLMAVAESASGVLTATQERALAAVLRVIADAGADVDARDAGGRTALHRALTAGNLAAARALLLTGASLAAVSPADGYSASDLVFSMGGRGAALVQWLADAGKLPDVNARNSRGVAPIHIAVFTARKGDLALVKKLVQLGADITDKDASGRSAMDHAIILGNTAITDFFHDLAVKCAVAIINGDSSPDPAKLAC
jgi:ankyrin repeat protein